MLTLVIGNRPGLEFVEVGAGVAALVAVVGAIEAGTRAYRINLGSQARPRIAPSTLPDDTSRAFAPLMRLAARERDLADHVRALPAAVAADTWRQASTAARALRAHAARITAVEKALRAGQHGASEIDLLAVRLQEGVSAYERLADTAAELVAQHRDGPVAGEASVRLADATDALVGMTRGLAS